MRETVSEISRRAAAERAQVFREQAQVVRGLAAKEPLAQRRALLLLSAARYERLAAADEMLAYGRRREHRIWTPKPAANEPPPKTD